MRKRLSAILLRAAGTGLAVLSACGGGGGSSSSPSAGLVSVHNSQTDPATGDYLADGKRFSNADVQHNLVALCGECHASAATELKASIHFTVAVRSVRVLYPGGGSHAASPRRPGSPTT